MSKHVDRLERDGLVTRTPSPRPAPGRPEADGRGPARAAARPLAPHRLARLAPRPARPRELAAVDAAIGPLSRLLAEEEHADERRTFASLRYRNYRLFFAGQAVSQIGTWMQRIALAWLVLQLTTHTRGRRRPPGARQFLPFTLFGLFAGVITDRLDARRLVIATQASQLVTASALTWIAFAGFAQPWMLDTIAFAAGLVLVLDVPSRQQLTYRMVGREALPNAIALNSSLFNASRILGPAAAGIVSASRGAGVCFLVNAISFLAVLLGLFAMRTSDFFPLEEFERPSILRGTHEGLAYVRKQPRMLTCSASPSILSTFCFNFNVTLPVLAKKTLHADAIFTGFSPPCSARARSSVR